MARIDRQSVLKGRVFAESIPASRVMRRPPRPDSRRRQRHQLRRTLHAVSNLLESHQRDFESLRSMQAEWTRFQSTLHRLIHLVDGNGRPPVSERLLVLEEQCRRTSLACEQLDHMKLKLIGLLVGVIISLVAALFSFVR